MEGYKNGHCSSVPMAKSQIETSIELDEKWYKGETQNGHEKKDEVAIVMVPFPAQAHLNQLLHLSHLIITSYGLPVHYAGSTVHNRQVKLRGWDPETDKKIQFHDLPLPPYSVPPPNPKGSTHFPAHFQPLIHAYTHLREPMFQLLQDLSSKYRRIVVIQDVLVSSVVQDVKLIPNAEAYVLVPVSVFDTFMCLWEMLPEKPFELHSQDIPSSIPSGQNLFTPEFEDFVFKQLEFLDFQSGRLFNSSRLIEGTYLDLLQRLPIYSHFKNFAIGPFNLVADIKTTSTAKQSHGCLEWLDKQEADSVIYVSFGTTTTMTDEQIRELAKGLEQSGEKFIWVLRRADKADIFAGDEAQNPALPEGYEDRVKNRGMVVTDWAPQLEILGHPSIAWFMSHCGWNSSVESISNGVPIAAWPMHSDQPRNAVLITQVLKIGITVRGWELQADLVTSDTIEGAVRRMMASKEGKEMRKRAAELGEAIRGSVAEGGASRLEMESLIAHITRS